MLTVDQKRRLWVLLTEAGKNKVPESTLTEGERQKHQGALLRQVGVEPSAEVVTEVRDLLTEEAVRSQNQEGLGRVLVRYRGWRG